MSKKIKAQDFYSPPNILTYTRILCVPAFVSVYFAVSGENNANVWFAFAIFLFATLTDALDGFIARKFGFTTELGKMLDPLADKLLHVSAAITLCVNGFVRHSELGTIWLFFPIALGLKEGIMLVWGIRLAKRTIIVHSNRYGKVASAINSVGLLLSFFARDYWDVYRIVTTVILSVGTAASYFALVDYGRKLYQQLDHSLEGKSDMILKF